MRNLSEIQIDVRALRENFLALRSAIPATCRIAAVVKGNAYGHGLSEVVEALKDIVDAFQVDDLEELRAIRRLTQNRVLVLGYVPLSQVAEAVKLGGELAIYDRERLAAIASAGQRPRVHLKIDALLGRQGVPVGQMEAFLDDLKRHEVEVDSAYAHFANIEDTTDLGHAQAQIEAFEAEFTRVKADYPDVHRHLSATSGAFTVEDSMPRSDWVRLGIGLYGLYPSAALSRTHRHLDLRPVLRWVSHLAQVKTLPARHPIGYGLTYVTARETRIGIVPQGYSDGYDRGLSNSGEVLIHGHRCAVLGRIAMNMFAVDLSDVPDAAAEDEVVLLGAQGDDCISAEEIAARLGTINYEVVSRISPLLPRHLI